MSLAFELDHAGRLLPTAAGLSDEQKRALDLDRHVIVLAGAGSGKTRTLARRVVRVLGSFAWEAATQGRGPGPDAILVTTFTERAAAEMRERIRGDLLSSVRALAGDGAGIRLLSGLDSAAFGRYQRHLRRALDDLDRARIGTTHALCASLLREHAAILGLDPGFSVVVGRDLRDLEGAALDAGMAVLDRVTAPGDAFFALGRSEWREALATLLRRRHDLTPWCEDFEGDDDAVMTRLILRWARPNPELAARILGPDSEFETALEQMLAGAARNGEPDLPFVAPILALRGAVASLGAQGGPLSAFFSLRSALQPLMGSSAWKKTHASWTGKKAAWRNDGVREGVQAAWDQARQILCGLFGEDGRGLLLLPGPADPGSVAVLRLLQQVGAVARHELETRKARLHVLDFADLEARTRDLLLGANGLPASLRGRFRHVLVDEFQDTNASQWDIVQRLLGDPLPDRGLFLVGDPKQAIYRFRGGDVSMFDRAVAQLGPQGAVTVPFAGNYRTESHLLTGINTIFEWLLPSAGSKAPYEAAFEALDARRVGAPGRLVLVDPAAIGPMAVAEAGDDADDEQGLDPRIEEARVVAKAAGDLVRMLQGRPRGVAILFRRRTWLDPYLVALRDAGVPFTVAGGQDFWSRQEVQDLASLLLCLSQPDDIVSLAGALRGPYLGLEDAALLWLVGQREGRVRALREAWDDALGGRLDVEIEALADAWTRPFRRALARARRWSLARAEVPLSRLLRLVLEESHSAVRFALLDPSGQVAANVEKVVAMAVDEDARGATAALAFARSLREEATLGSEEAEAVIDGVAPVVVMTVHQSKGLEFPWVLLPDLGARLLHPETGVAAVGRLDDVNPRRWDLGLRMGIPTEDGWTREPTLPYHRIAALGRLEERAEAARLFYVACTRAEDGLVLFARRPAPDAPPPLPYSARSAEDWIHGWMADDGRVTLEPWTDPGVPTHSGTGTVPIATPTADDLSPIRTIRRRVLHPTDLVLSTLEHRGAGSASPSPTAARLRGTLVHAAIEDGGKLPLELIEARVRSALAEVGLLDDRHVSWLLTELISHLDGYVRAAPLALLDASVPAVVLREVAFRLPLPWELDGDPVELDGVADMIWRDEEHRQWVVIDHKSDDADPHALATHYAPQLLAYVWAACRIIPDVRDGGWTVRAEILSTRHGVRVLALPPRRLDEAEGALKEAVLRLSRPA